MLLVSLDSLLLTVLLLAVVFLCFHCRPSVCCVLNVACISGSFILDFPFCLLCCSFAFITQKDDNESKGTTQQAEGTVNNKKSKDPGKMGHRR
jgi:hypothetical protein